MNHNLYTILLSLAISGALLIVGAMAVGQAPRLPAPTDDNLQLKDVEIRAIEATTEASAADERKQRRNRASLSMPYFSFAQSPRPRG